MKNYPQRDISLQTRTASRLTDAALAGASPAPASELRHKDEQFHQRALELEMVYAAAPFGFCLVNKQLQYLRINESLAEMNGVPAAHILGRSLREIIPMLADQVEPIYREVFATGNPVLNRELRGSTGRAPAQPRDWLVSHYPLKDASGAILSVAGIVQDITERKQAERYLKEAEEALRMAHVDLELRVSERTTEIMAANQELKRQIAERHRLEKELIEITEAERVRIGQSLHDDLGQRLTGIALLTKGLQDRLAKKRLREAVDANRIQSLANDAISHTRELARNLTSVQRGGDDLSAALDTLAIQTRRLFNVSCRFKSLGAIPKLEEAVARHFYNIAQEAVTNAIRHGKALHISIRLSSSADHLVLAVRNNGEPFPSAIRRGEGMGLGLRIMHYRASVVGARLKIGSNRKRGASIVCALPVRQQLLPGLGLEEPAA